MRLTFERFDGRSQQWVDIIDEDSGEKVGSIHSMGVGPGAFGGIYISLFGDKYKMTVNRSEDCWGFVKGVEAVLNHMISTNYRGAQATAA